MKRAFVKIGGVVGAAVITSSLIAGCSTSSDTIKIGAIAGLTGNFITEEVVKTAQRVFDDANEQGGINGKKIEFIVKDDAGDPKRTAQVARELADAKVVAMTASGSFTDCDVNDAYYRQQKISSIMAVGASPKCYQSPNIAPVNVGPFTLITAELMFASETLKNERICNFTVMLPGSEEAVNNALGQWSKITGKQLVVNDTAVQQSGDLTPYLLRAKQERCDAILFNPGEQMVVPFLKAAQTQGMSDVDFLLLAPAYTESVAKAIGDLGLKVYAGSEFEPFTAESDANRPWKDAVTRAKASPTAFSQGGYLAARFMVDVLKTIKGDVTRESVNEALKNMAPISDPMVGTPFVFGQGDRHAPNQASKMVELKDSAWSPIGDFITVPTSS
ncbi:ABC transporter substrate-binding protein [Actinokineospora auranticolor]|uniref:Branched-chain amino acid transport system substrate-binding protein n=1 Tax=Actinokineospora auranticolor TaxID=155976 RepID=A0A2S6GMI0_9PSEU|nr:ABC transporter substrate-binding protein [Actinokineospora auranticolor]PPK66449.1 branched-chain amino acid transport system substrate-binding protein [Actinokineospora auranticolor]